MRIKMGFLALSLFAACQGGPDSVNGEIDEVISEVVVIGGPRAFGLVGVIPSVDQISPQSFSISAGFGDADEISDEAIIEIGNGRVLIDTRSAERRLQRKIKVNVVVRTPRSIEIIGGHFFDLSLSDTDPIESIRVSGGAHVSTRFSTSFRSEALKASTTHLYVEDSDFSGEFRLGHFIVEGVRANLALGGVSERFTMSLVDSMQFRSVGGNLSTEVDLVRSEVNRICALGSSTFEVTDNSRLVYNHRCSEIVPNLVQDETSTIEKTDI